jgi:phosphatidylglycerol:prolipoprotein diacylglycerol transferase
MFPELTQIFEVPLPTYGVLYLIAFALGLWLVGSLARQAGLDASRVRMCGVYCVVVSRLVSTAVDGVITGAGLSLTAMLRSTGAFFWALIPGILFAAVYYKYHRMPALRVLDCFSAPLVLAQAIGRLGCFAAGCCFGTPTTSPLGVVYTDPRAHALSQVPLNVPLHPTQLYEAAGSLIIFAWLLWLYPRRSFSGQVFTCMLIATSTARLLWESFRGDTARGFLCDGISLPRFVAGLILAFALVLYFPLRGKGSRESRPKHS